MPRLETGVGICEKDHTCGINGRPCLQCGNEFTPSKLLYPVRQKDYATDIFIRNEWDRLGDALGHGYFLTIFGYSAPKTDVEARKLMLGDWKGNSTLQLAEVEVIDVKPTEELEANWEEFFVKTHYMIRDNVFDSYLFMHPRRGCDAFAAATLMCNPWRDNPFPRLRSLVDLQRWVRPLIEEEVHCATNKVAFSGKPIPQLG